MYLSTCTSKHVHQYSALLGQHTLCKIIPCFPQDPSFEKGFDSSLFRVLLHDALGEMLGRDSYMLWGNFALSNSVTNISLDNASLYIQLMTFRKST